MGSRIEHRLGTLLIAFLSGALVLLSVAFFLSRQPKNPPSKAERSFGLEDKDIFLYLEAIAKIKEDASFLTQDLTREQIIRESIKAYLSQKDSSSDYLTRDEYRKFKESQDDRYVGIGMEIKKARDGRILCVPYPGGPAATAGITVGDELKKIDGISVYGKSVFAVASMARGKPGTELNLVIATKSGIDKEVRLRRSAVTTDSVSTYQLGKTQVIKIVSFTRDTSDKLKRVLKIQETGRPIILDLRGNAGGDLHAAIDSASLFLQKGKKIVSINTRKQPKTYESNVAAVNLSSPLYLWQDEATASAAEVFVAALTENDRAVSIGKTTFGKGTVQDIIELSDGSAIVLTTGRLETPRGGSYDGDGLAPTYRVSGDTTMYLTKVEELAAVKSHGRPK
jgi:carboxyl-terminal processing protease